MHLNKKLSSKQNLVCKLAIIYNNKYQIKNKGVFYGQEYQNSAVEKFSVI